MCNDLSTNINVSMANKNPGRFTFIQLCLAHEPWGSPKKAKDWYLEANRTWQFQLLVLVTQSGQWMMLTWYIGVTGLQK